MHTVDLLHLFISKQIHNECQCMLEPVLDRLEAICQSDNFVSLLAIAFRELELNCQ